MIPAPYAFEITGRATAIPMALWLASYEHTQGVLGERFKLRFAPVRGAFVACVRLSEDRASVRIRKEDVILGRTNEAGWAVARERDAVGAPEDIPPAPKVKKPAPPLWFLTGDDPVTLERSQKVERDAICGMPNEAYRVFWTYDVGQFNQFVEGIEDDAQATFDAWQVPTHVVEPFGTPTDLSGLDLLHDDERKAVSRLLLPGRRAGYHAGWYFKDSTTAAIFDVTPPGLRALYLCEWLEWYSAHLYEDANWRALATARHVVDVTKAGGPVWDFDEEARQYMVKTLTANVGGAVGERDWRAFWDYRRYAHECAEAGAKLSWEKRKDLRDHYVDALKVQTPGGAWREAAAVLAKQYRIFHPSATYAIEHCILENEAAWNPFVAYFDYYATGFLYQYDGFSAAVRAARDRIDEAFGWLHAQRQRSLRPVRVDQFLVQIARSLAPGGAARIQELCDRYTRQCATLQLAWWLDADETHLATAAQWQTFTNMMGWVGSLGNGVSTLLQGFVKTHLLTQNVDASLARAALRLTLRFDRWLESGLIDAAQLDGGQGKFAFISRSEQIVLSLDYQVSSTSGAVKSVSGGEYQILKSSEVESLQAVRRQHGPFPSNTSSAEVLRELQLTFGKRIIDLPCNPQQVTRLEGASGVIGDLANLLNAALAVRKLQQMSAAEFHFFDNRDVQVAGWSIMQGIGSVGQIVQVIRRVTQQKSLAYQALRWARYTGVAGLAMENAYNLQDGVTALYSDESKAAALLNAGDNTGATLEMVRGVGQVASGVGGLGGVAVAVFGSLSVAAAPFALVFGVGVALVVVSEAIIYGRESPNKVQPLIDSVERAKRLEFHLDARGHSTQRDAEEPRLRQRIGVLNHVLNRERAG